MAGKLDGQIKAVEDKITKVGCEIDDVSEQLKPIVAQLADPELRGEHRPELLEREKRLGKKEEQLRAEKEQLRAEKVQLRAEKELLLTAELQHGAAADRPRSFACIL